MIDILFFASLWIMHVGSEQSATLTDCPSGTQRINNGCYQFYGQKNWSLAKATCDSLVVSAGQRAHLLTLESETEVIGLQIWFKGYDLMSNYWTEGGFLYSQANSKMEINWEWSRQTAYLFNYWKHSSVYYASANKLYLHFNGTISIGYNGGHEYRSDDSSASKKVICEISMPCLQKDNVCQNNASCYINAGLVMCTCLEGYVGSLCEELIDNCESVPCKHGGTCSNKVNNYTCSCTKFYSGRNCEIEVFDQNLENGISAAVALSLIVVILSFVLLIVIDLPWKTFFKLIDEKKKKIVVRIKEIKVDHKKDDETTENDDTLAENIAKKIVTAETEMLDKLQKSITARPIGERSDTILF